MCIHTYILIITFQTNIICSSCNSVCLTRRSYFVRMELPCVMLWRPEALDCRMLIPPEAWNGLTPNPPSL